MQPPLSITKSRLSNSYCTSLSKGQCKLSCKHLRISGMESALVRFLIWENGHGRHFLAKSSPRWQEMTGMTVLSPRAIPATWGNADATPFSRLEKRSCPSNIGARALRMTGNDGYGRFCWVRSAWSAGDRHRRFADGARPRAKPRTKRESVQGRAPGCTGSRFVRGFPEGRLPRRERPATHC